MLNQVSSFLFTNCIMPIASSQPVAIGMGAVCAIPALESAFCAIQDVGGMFSSVNRSIQDEKEEDYQTRNSDFKKKQFKELVEHSLVALFLGACVVNVIPGSAALGALSFLVYSKIRCKHEIKAENPSKVIMYTGFAVQILWAFKLEILKRGCRKIKAAALILGKGISKIWHVAKNVFKGIGRCFKLVLKPLKGLTKVGVALVKHPLIGAGVLAVTAIAVTALTFPAVGGVVVGTAKVAGTVVSFIPTAIYHLFSGIITVARFILRV